MVLKLKFALAPHRGFPQGRTLPAVNDCSKLGDMLTHSRSDLENKYSIPTEYQGCWM